MKVTRRGLLKGLALAGSWLALRALNLTAPDAAGQEPQPTPYYFLPIIQHRASPYWPASSRVVHIHAPAATHWDFGSSWYGDHVDQAMVNAMVEEGLRQLTGAASAAAAWGILLPSYQPGQKIAIKINLNNSSCSDSDNIIDALMQPINAVIGSLVSAGIGVQSGDIWVYDAIRSMPARLYSQRQYTQAHYAAASCGDYTATFNHADPSLRVTFTNPAMQTERWLTDILHEATYLINMPIIKRHSTAPVTLGFKHHFGSLSNLGGSGDDNPHVHINPSNSHYHSNYSPLVDIYSNPNIAGKTVLTLGDGLFGAPMVNDKPAPWSKTFGGALNSLFFSRDPVAIDSVMIGWLNAEWGVVDAAYDYLLLAEQAGLGIAEKADPRVGGSYKRIDYVRFDL
jgi:uncharacterized protein (DUF362 family)